MNAPKRFSVNELTHKLMAMTTNLLLSRSSALLGGSLDTTERNIDTECGYPETDPSIDQYRSMYERVGIATRIINVYPSESWSVPPLVYQTEKPSKTAWERAWNRIAAKHAIFHYLERIDELSGIGRFGVMLIGTNDGNPLNQPVRGVNEKGQKVENTSKKPRDLLYLRTFPEYLVQIKEIEQDSNNPRYGQPKLYNVKMSDPKDLSESAPVAQAITDQDVHWTRVLHVADNRQSSEVFGRPRLKPVYNDILDIRKVKGGGAEMFWKGAFPGISFETYPELTDVAELDAESVKQEIEAYSNGLQRYMRLIGMTAKSLAPQVADPSNHLTALLQLICATIQVPLRVFMGSEAAHLASQQDSVAWNRRLRHRQDLYLTPMVLRPFIDRLMLLDILPTIDEYIIEWRDLNVLSETDRAKISLQKAQAILQYVTSGAFALVPPRLFLELVLEFSPAEAQTIIEEAGGEGAVIKTLKDFVSQEAGNTPSSTGTKPEQKTGATGRRNGL
jgi:hypothetical protein